MFYENENWVKTQEFISKLYDIWVSSTATFYFYKQRQRGLLGAETYSPRPRMSQVNRTTHPSLGHTLDCQESRPL